nr:VOC family protein [Frondihabitans sucicola]
MHRFAPVHEFTFTPSLSLAVDCATAADVDQVVEALVDGGEVLMELGSYPFSARYAWITDRFGVSWQVGVAAAA